MPVPGNEMYAQEFLERFRGAALHCVTPSTRAPARGKTCRAESAASDQQIDALYLGDVAAQATAARLRQLHGDIGRAVAVRGRVRSG